jgi:hypothetical protein
MKIIVFFAFISVCFLSTNAMAIPDLGEIPETGNRPVCSDLGEVTATGNRRVCPEPGTFALLGIGMGAIAYVNRFRKRRISKK